MSDTPTPADRCPKCDHPIARHDHIGCWIVDCRCSRRPHSSPVDSPEADTPNPADVSGHCTNPRCAQLRQAVAAHEDCCGTDFWPELRYGSSAGSGVQGTGPPSSEPTAPAATATAAGAPSDRELLAALLDATDQAVASRIGNRLLCPTCGSDDRGDLYGNEEGSRCPDLWHSSPVPAADTPNPADNRSTMANDPDNPMVKLRDTLSMSSDEVESLAERAKRMYPGQGYRFAVEDATDGDLGLTNYSDGGDVWVPLPIVVDALAAAGLRVVQVPDGLPERLREIADPNSRLLGYSAARDVAAAAALLGGETER